MSNPLPPVPQPEIVKGQSLLAPWQSWFYQLYTYLTAASAGGGGLVNITQRIDTTAPLTGGGDLSANRTLSILPNGITNAYLAQMPAFTIKGNNTALTGNALDLSASQVKAILGISLTTDVSGTLQAAQEPAHTGDVINSAGSLAMTITNNVVSNAKLDQMPTLTIKGNNTGGTANALDLTASQVKALLAISLTTDVSGTLQAAQEPAHTGEVTNSAGNLALTILKSISPTWTGNHTFTPGSGVGVTINATTDQSLKIVGTASGTNPYVSWITNGATQQWDWQLLSTGAFRLLDRTRVAELIGFTTAGNITMQTPTTGDTLTVGPSATTGALMASSAALTTGAGVSVGTLTNAPSAGNPTKWIKINDNGTIRSIPAW